MKRVKLFARLQVKLIQPGPPLRNFTKDKFGDAEVKVRDDKTKETEMWPAVVAECIQCW